MTDRYNIVLEQEQSTVIAKYTDTVMPLDAYQSEAKLETSFIRQLTEQGYEYLPKLTNEQELITNLRHQLELLNDYRFTDNEWNSFFTSEIARENMTIDEKTQIIQRDYVLLLTCDNGENRNIRLLDKRNIHNNCLQVINQYVPEGGVTKNRYDVTILVNGLPLVHVELKRRGMDIKQAFNQIARYQRESFWAGRALFDYVQIFVISNGTHTKYYSNTTRFAKEEENQQQKQIRCKTESNSFEFTSWWSDEQNNQLPDLRAFTETFFAKHTILNILTKYCVFTADKNLLVMRPYQIAATEKILRRVETAINNKWQGTIRAGGYIWHTTGSGKTLTSFKTAQLCTQLKDVEKVLFVVDRLDLDYQTMKEYDNFEKDCANSNSDYKILLRQLNDPRCHIIITTIQKLAALLRRKSEDIKILQANIVMIFDECHRSQFGKMGGLIRKKFKNHIISALRVHLSLPRMPCITRIRNILQLHRHLEESQMIMVILPDLCIPIPLLMLLKIRMSCVSVWTMSTQSKPRQRLLIPKYGVSKKKVLCTRPNAFKKWSLISLIATRRRPKQAMNTVIKYY